MDASDSGEGGAADAGEPIWDWGNLLDFVVQDDDSLVLPWDDAAAGIGGAADPTEAAAPLLPSPLPQPVEVELEPEPELGPVLPPPPLRVQGIGRRVRKRDPRLVCPNYLAGRVPCACPEVDEMVAAAEVEDVATEFLAGARKKTKTAAGRRGKAGAAGGGGVAGGTVRAAAMEMKCQVPECGADIRELKGYHRRHRVCLRCAHAAAVMLDGVQKRYCQQCGKFHVLQDFDEDKRSCRRKLERHNKRRRRKPDSKGILDKEIDEQLDLSADVSGDGELREENMEGTTSEMLETVLSNKVLDRGTPAGSEDVLSSPICTQPSLQNEQSKSVVTFAASVEACIGANQENAKLTTNSPMHDTKSAYSSSVGPFFVLTKLFIYISMYDSACPTGRISFKLYDWNPAEFPRRLRHQIFEWLASMPVELEGYIRPGCTILTVFVAMPQHMWDKLSDDAANLLRNLVNSPNSLLLGKGAFFIHINNMIFQVLKDGATLMSTRLDVQSPRIDYVHPTWFEAGKPVELILCGSSLDQPKFRSLLSFDGDYLKHDCYRLTSHDTFNCIENGDLILDSQREIFRIDITQSRPDIHGPAFVEVENMFGLSNFIPILFGSKQLCSELERIQDALCGSSNSNLFGELPSASSDPCERRKHQMAAMSEFLIDIGWLIRKPTPDEFKNVLSSTNIQRWVCIMNFLIQNDFINVLEIIVKSMDNIMGSEVLSNLETGRLEDHVTAFLGYVSHARNIIDRRANNDEKTQLETRWVSVCSPNQPSLGTSLPLANENTGTYEEETASLVTRDVSHRHCCQPDMNARWLKRSLVVKYPGGATRMRLGMTVVIAAVLCFTACLALFHPHGVGVLASPVKRYLSSDSAS
ncbi:Squamosa promoter-binding-like protein 9 [Dichanthelium oligosanthes]|uniref:Squamosa promoter-binding-like protein 9 n=1 Tax=Dichanthelium oligosanthes TaxID=888268 RepID=A0A1E5VG69_9POAL|nr:Squamosa promoter-binding-like protein 9 [Dichanthelium oligosanthes]